MDDEEFDKLLNQLRDINIKQGKTIDKLLSSRTSQRNAKTLQNTETKCLVDETLQNKTTKNQTKNTIDSFIVGDRVLCLTKVKLAGLDYSDDDQIGMVIDFTPKRVKILTDSGEEIIRAPHNLRLITANKNKTTDHN